MGVGILRQYVLSQVIEWSNGALFAIFPYFLSKLSVYIFIVCISLTFHIKLDLWLNILIHNSRGAASIPTINNLTCIMRCVGCPWLLMAPINHLFIWAALSSRLMLSISLSLSLQWATFKLSCPVILINSVYLSAVIIENGPYNFSRHRLGVERLTSILLCSFFSRLPAFSELEQKNNNKISHISCGMFHTLSL